jgi:diketogulonate reductase-like aldo/keto reductase
MVLEDPTILKLAEKHGKTPAQIVLRHIVQNGMVVIPKSSKHERIVENFSIFDFSLSPVDMAELSVLDQGSKARTFDGYWMSFDRDVQKIKDFPFAGKDEY